MTDWKHTARVLRRASIGASGAEIDAAAAMGIDRWLDTALADSPEPVYPDLPIIDPPGKGATQDQRLAYNRALGDQARLLLSWWVRQMLTTSTPVAERLLLGWHAHWATSISKVKQPRAMLAQNRTLRRTGLGSFTAMANAMVTDPALMIYLDAQQNTKAAPNENLARELMELFCLGVGSGYTETDVKEAARALTGWRVGPAGATFDPRRHDDGLKTLLGVTGKLDAPAAVAAILASPAHPALVARRWWKQLASPESPPPATLTRLTSAYGSGRDSRALIRAVLTDPAFDAAAGSMVLSPVEWVVGAARTLHVPATDQVVMTLTGAMRALGQVPLQPPNVSGWPSGQAWLSTASAQTRAATAQRLARAADLGTLTDTPAAGRVDALAHLLGLTGFSPRTISALATAKGNPVTLTAIGLISPEYQVA